MNLMKLQDVKNNATKEKDVGKINLKRNLRQPFETQGKVKTNSRQTQGKVKANSRLTQGRRLTRLSKRV